MGNFIDKLQFKFRRYGIDNLMIYITGTMLAIYLCENITRLPITSLLTLNMAKVMGGEVWRLITFIVVPPQNTSIIWLIVSLYFYYFIGTTLENTWGASKFTLFYIFGVVGAIIAGVITGHGDNMYLNLSMFLAFAALAPNQQVLLFFVLPIKVKVLAIIDLVMLAFSFIAGSWSTRAAIIASLINVILFFYDDFMDYIDNYKKYGKQRRNFKKSVKRQNDIYGDR